MEGVTCKMPWPSSSPAAVATDAVDPRRARRPRATPARGIRSRSTSSPSSLGFPLSPQPYLSLFSAADRNPSLPPPRHCRRSELPRTNRFRGELRLDVFYFLTKLRFAEWPQLAAINKLPQLPREDPAVDSVAVVDPPTSPTTPTSAW